MNRHRIVRLRVLVESLRQEIDRLEWVDLEAFEDGKIEIDGDFDYGFGFMPEAVDDDIPDETDEGPIGPLCVECGNYGRSCVC